MTTYPDLYPHYSRAERLEAWKEERRKKIDALIEERDNYEEFLSKIPAAIYNQHIEIYTAELSRLDNEIDAAIDEADRDYAEFKRLIGQ